MVASFFSFRSKLFIGLNLMGGRDGVGFVHTWMQSHPAFAFSLKMESNVSCKMDSTGKAQPEKKVTILHNIEKLRAGHSLILTASSHSYH